MTFLIFSKLLSPSLSRNAESKHVSRLLGYHDPHHDHSWSAEEGAPLRLAAMAIVNDARSRLRDFDTCYMYSAGGTFLYLKQWMRICNDLHQVVYVLELNGACSLRWTSWWRTPTEYCL